VSSTDRDRHDTAPVVVVNEAFVRTFLPGQDPLGRQVRIPVTPLNDPTNRVAYQRATVVEIVGVAADVKHASLTQPSEPSLYQPHEQLTYRKVTVMVRTSQEPAVIIDQIRREVASMDRSLPLEFRLLSQVTQASLSRQLLGMLLMVAFGTAALVLAAVGIYGVLAYSVAQRTRELAIRAALGASSGGVRALIIRQGVLLAATGIVLGVMGALAMSRLVASQLHEVSPSDVTVFITVPLLLFVIALMSTLIPAAVAGRVDPALMLRSE
jgi:putative ABC transport system permease protein